MPHQLLDTGRFPHRALALLAPLALFAACLPTPLPTTPPAFDLKPPTLVEAGPTGLRSFVLRFDEDVRPVEGSFELDPGESGEAPTAKAMGADLKVELGADQVAGKGYKLLGEVVDGGGNGSRFLLSFAGFNANPAKLRISEVVPAKNSSQKNPHRDFVEFEVVAAGNLGGLEFSGSSSTKTVTWTFPGAEVAQGELVVLHCAPEGIAAERDETGTDMESSGGIDASAARDFWSKAGALPDATGVLVLSESPGGKPMDGLFYADSAKVGPVGEGRIESLVQGLVDFGLWSTVAAPAWEDAFRWKPSASRSIIRSGSSKEAGAEPGLSEWALSATGGQSPGSR
ncbi:MAG: hypothetical protein WCQ50_05320 [Spirochaetota bacterium]